MAINWCSIVLLFLCRIVVVPVIVVAAEMSNKRNHQNIFLRVYMAVWSWRNNRGILNTGQTWVLFLVIFFEGTIHPEWHILTTQHKPSSQCSQMWI